MQLTLVGPARGAHWWVLRQVAEAVHGVVGAVGVGGALDAGAGEADGQGRVGAVAAHSALAQNYRNNIQSVLLFKGNSFFVPYTVPVPTSSRARKEATKRVFMLRDFFS